MRKTSQDCGDNTSITSCIENEIKKSSPGILQTTKNSIRRKMQNFSNEGDDAAVEPLLHNNKEKNEFEKQSAKIVLSKTKTDLNERDKSPGDDNIKKPEATVCTEIGDVHISIGLKNSRQDSMHSISATSVHNYMNTNVFHRTNGVKSTGTTKSQVLVEVNTSKPLGYNQSPLIFTTAKIHTDGKIPQMQPVQINPVPILSTIEGGIVKSETRVNEFEKSNDAVAFPVTSVNADNSSLQYLQNKDKDIKIKHTMPVCTTISQILKINNISSDETLRSRNNVEKKEKKEANELTSTVSTQPVSNLSNLTKKDFTRAGPFCSSSTSDKSYVDINKNVHPESRRMTEKKTEDYQAEQKIMYSQPSGTKAVSSKEVKSTTHSDISLKEKTSDDIPECTDNTYKIKTNAILKKPEENVSKKEKTGETIESVTSRTVTSIPSVIKSNGKEHVIKSPVTKITTDSHKINTMDTKTPHFSTSTTPISVPNKTKFVQAEKDLSITAGKEAIPQVNPFTSNTISNVTSVPRTLTSIKTTTVNSVSASSYSMPLTTSTVNTKTTPVISSTVTAGDLKLSCSIYSTTSESASKTKSTPATVVSSISKTTTTKLNSKFLPSSSTVTVTSTPTLKQFTSASTVKNVSSVPTTKSTVGRPVSQAKKTGKGGLDSNT